MDLDAGTISFLNDGSSGAIADISGNWQPGINGVPGSAPANYGAQVEFLGTGRAAVRDLVANATADSLPLTPDGSGGYAFGSTQTLTILQGEIDYSHPIGGSGRGDISNLSAQNSAGPGNLQDNGDGTFTVTVPVDLTLTIDILGVTAHLRISGSITGNGGPFGAAPGGSGRTVDFAAALAHGSGVTTPGSAFVTADVSNLGESGSAQVPTVTGAAQATYSNSQDEGTALRAGHSIVSSDQVLAIDTVAIEMIRTQGVTF